MNIWITGGEGQLGKELQMLSKNLPGQYYFTDLPQLDITDLKAVKLFIERNSIDTIINTAAYTAVDKAESEPELASRINSLAVGDLAEIAYARDIKLIHISTDFVFRGDACLPYVEESSVNPISVYGKSKAEGEQILMEKCRTGVIIRTSWLYSSFGNNFLKTILRLAKERKEIKVVSDQIGTPTYAYDLAKIIFLIIDKWNMKTSPIYHFSNEGIASWYDFAHAIVEINNLPCKVIPIPTSEYSTPAQRPAYSVLSKNKIRSDFNLAIKHWRDALKNCINCF